MKWFNNFLDNIDGIARSLEKEVSPIADKIVSFLTKHLKWIFDR